MANAAPWPCGLGVNCSPTGSPDPDDTSTAPGAGGRELHAGFMTKSPESAHTDGVDTRIEVGWTGPFRDEWRRRYFVLVDRPGAPQVGY